MLSEQPFVPNEVGVEQFSRFGHGRFASSPNKGRGIALYQVILLLGLLWGGITAFSMNGEDWSTKAQAFALLFAMVLGVASLGFTVVVAWVRWMPGLLLSLHVGVAIGSGLLFGSSLEIMLRYGALIPVFSILIATAKRGELEWQHLRLGLTLSGMAYVCFHMIHIDWSEIANPAYRLSVFVNPNTVGFIAVITALSAIEFAFGQSKRKLLRFFWLAAFVSCLLLWLSTKSRTALLALIAGVMTLSLLRVQSFRARATLIAGLMLGLFMTLQFQGVFINTLSLDDQYRSIGTATGRFTIWEFVLSDIVSESPWFGVGAGNHFELVSSGVGHSSSHNGILMALAETGIVGTFPILILIAIGFLAIFRDRRHPQMWWAASIFVAGVTESFGEVMFLNIGNPGSLLFLLALAVITCGDRCAFKPSSTEDSST